MRRAAQLGPNILRATVGTRILDDEAACGTSCLQHGAAMPMELVLWYAPRQLSQRMSRR
jgi:hypothetical protein